MATIAEEITALRQRISSAYDVIDQKGGDVPEERTSWNLSAAIDSIQTGGEPEATLGVSSLYAVMPNQGTATSFGQPMAGPYKLDLSFLTAINEANVLNSAVGHICYGVGAPNVVDSGSGGQAVYNHCKWMPNISAVDCSNLETVLGNCAMTGMFSQYQKSTLPAAQRPDGWDGRYTVDFSKLKSVNGGNAMWEFGWRSNPIEGWNFPSLTGLTGTACCFYCFAGCSLRPHGLSALQQVNGAYLFSYGFNWGSTITDGDIPSNEGVYFDALSSITGTFAFNYAFTEANFRNVHFPKLSSVTQSYCFQRAFNQSANPNAALSGVYFPALTTVSNGYTFYQAFYGNKTVKDMSFPALKSVMGNYTFAQAFMNAPGISAVHFPELTTLAAASTYMWNQGMNSTTAGASAWPKCHLYFPKLTTMRLNAANATFSLMNNQATAANRRTYAIHIGEEADAITPNVGTTAGNALFYNSRGLTDVYLHNFSSITGTAMFNGCSELTAIHFAADYEDAIKATAGYATLWGRGAGAATVTFEL